MSEPDRRETESEDRRQGERRRAAGDVPVERRGADRRRLPRRLVDVFRTFLGRRPPE